MPRRPRAAARHRSSFSDAGSPCKAPPAASLSFSQVNSLSTARYAPGLMGIGCHHAAPCQTPWDSEESGICVCMPPTLRLCSKGIFCSFSPNVKPQLAGVGVMWVLLGAPCPCVPSHMALAHRPQQPPHRGRDSRLIQTLIFAPRGGKAALGCPAAPLGTAPALRRGQGEPWGAPRVVSPPRHRPTLFWQDCRTSSSSSSLSSSSFWWICFIRSISSSSLWWS